MDWLTESWGYLVLGGGFLAAVVVAVRTTYAAERDRRALQISDLEREKLELEVARLRNNPDVVKDRRAIYDKLRELLSAITRAGSVDIGELAALQELKHESEYRYPTEVVAAMDTLLLAVLKLYFSNKDLKRGPHKVGAEEWPEVLETNTNALLEIVDFERGLVERFRPHLRL